MSAQADGPFPDRPRGPHGLIKQRLCALPTRGTHDHDDIYFSADGGAVA